VLEIDHIIPKSKLGGDTNDNKITACFECNRGKRDILLSDKKTQIKIKENLAILKERDVQLREYTKFLRKQLKKTETDIDDIACKWNELYYREHDLSDKGLSDIRNLLKRFTKLEICEAMNLSIRIESPEDRFRYMCGILYNWKPTPDRELKKYWKEQPRGSGYLPTWELQKWMRKYTIDEIKDAMDKARGYWTDLVKILDKNGEI